MQKKGLKELISSLILRETQIKVALSGVNLKEPVSAVFASSPQTGWIVELLHVYSSSNQSHQRKRNSHITIEILSV